MRKIKKMVWRFLIFIKIGGVVQLFLKSGLRDDGWFKSFNTKTSIDANGNPIPWCTYSFIKFIEPRLKKDFNIFEYGSGNSTLWYAKRVKYVKSVEHDKNWFNNLYNSYPSNVKAVYIPVGNNDEYANEIKNDLIKYHIVVIDGIDRNNCATALMDCLTDDGVIIYDNTQLSEYKSSIEFILQSGFKKIDFEGILPIVSHNNVTTIFYRGNNCLNI